MSRCDVTTLLVWPNGSTHESSSSNEWAGMSAKEARRNRLARLREARATVDLDGDALIVTTDKGEWVEVQRIEFTDEDEQLDLLAMEETA